MDRPADDQCERVATEQDPAAAEPMGLLLSELAALRTYLAYFAALKIDQLTAWTRGVIEGLVIRAIVLVLTAAMLVASCTFLLRGVAGGLASLMGQRAWAGDLVAGLLGIGAVLSSVTFVRFMHRRRWQRERLAEYARRKTEQREQIGQDVDDVVQHAP